MEEQLIQNDKYKSLLNNDKENYNINNMNN